MITLVRLGLALTLILVMTGLYYAIQTMGWQFAVGGMTGIIGINCYVRWKYGFWPGG